MAERGPQSRGDDQTEEAVRKTARLEAVARLESRGDGGCSSLGDDDQAVEAVRKMARLEAVARLETRVTKARLEAAARDHKAALIAKREAIQAKEGAWNSQSASAEVRMAAARLQVAEAQLFEADRAHRMALDVQQQAATERTRTEGVVTAALKEEKDGNRADPD